MKYYLKSSQVQNLILIITWSRKIKTMYISMMRDSKRVKSKNYIC